jgi:hypothetical protein
MFNRLISAAIVVCVSPNWCVCPKMKRSGSECKTSEAPGSAEGPPEGRLALASTTAPRVAESDGSVR